jgi:hypothetical protein
MLELSGRNRSVNLTEIGRIDRIDTVSAPGRFSHGGRSKLRQRSTTTS